MMTAQRTKPVEMRPGSRCTKMAMTALNTMSLLSTPQLSAGAPHPCECTPFAAADRIILISALANNRPGLTNYTFQIPSELRSGQYLVR